MLKEGTFRGILLYETASRYLLQPYDGNFHCTVCLCVFFYYLSLYMFNNYVALPLTMLVYTLLSSIWHNVC